MTNEAFQILTERARGSERFQEALVQTTGGAEFLGRMLAKEDDETGVMILREMGGWSAAVRSMFHAQCGDQAADMGFWGEAKLESFLTAHDVAQIVDRGKAACRAARGVAA